MKIWQLLLRKTDEYDDYDDYDDYDYDHLVWASPLATAAMSSTLDWLLVIIIFIIIIVISIIFMMNMIAIIMMIGMIKSWKYNDHHDNRVIIMISSHLSERCLKLPSVGGNCLPFNGAFSFPGSDDDGGDCDGSTGSECDNNYDGDDDDMETVFLFTGLWKGTLFEIQSNIIWH